MSGAASGAGPCGLRLVVGGIPRGLAVNVERAELHLRGSSRPSLCRSRVADGCDGTRRRTRALTHAGFLDSRHRLIG